MASTMAEIVYGTKEEGHVMSEKVSSLATDIYKEFERMIKKYDEDVVKELMPLVVNILENLDQTFTEKQETEVDQELLREDNEQLLTQYEREKQLRKAAEQKYMELEDAVEEEKKELESKVESLDHIVRMLELKGKNSADHLSRMEEKESEMKKEYNKLHERYTELMRTHMDYMERAKILMGTDRIAELGHSPRSRGIFHLPNLKQVNLIPGQGSTPLKSSGSPPGSNAFDMMSPQSGRESNISLRSELSDLDSPDVKEGTRGRPNSRRGRATSDKEQNTDAVDVRESATATKTQDEKSDSAVVPPASVENVSMPEGEAVTSVSMPSGEAVAVSMPSEEAVESSPLVQDKSKSSTVSSSEQSQTDLSHPESSQSKSESSASQTSSRDISQPPSAVIEKSVEKSERVEKPTDQAKETVSVQEKSSVVEPGVNVRVDVNVHVDRNSSSGGGPRSPQSPGFVGMEDAFEEDNIPGLDRTIAHIVATTPELEEMEESTGSSQSMNTSGRLQSSSRNDASIYDELTVQDADLIGDVDFGADITDSDDEQERNSTVSDNFFGMGKELENLILENTELLATKNALNVVKDDLIAKLDELTSEQEILREEINSLQVVKTKLHEKIKDLEIELKKTKEELEKKNQTAKEQEDEDDVPMAQRKRFTRVEMARVLMERNQYKERLMELQEAVRWTEMIRASREHPEITQVKKKSSIWNFFSNLFTSSSSPNKPKAKTQLPMATIKYNAPTTMVQPVGDPNKKQRGKYNLGDKAKAYDFLQDDLSEALDEPVLSQPNTSEKAKKEREKERKEQYKQVRAHVKKDDGRMQAYGWSLPAKFQPQIPNAAATKSSVPVPVPIYCRPLLEKETALKIWCAAGVNLTGGRTRDGGSIVGASVFYSSPPESETSSKKGTGDDVDKLDQELQDHEKNMKHSEKEQLSSFVWICTSTHTESSASVVDANNPGDILETFRVSTTPLLCIASVPGALESDYPVDEDILKAESYPQYPSTDAANNNASSAEESGVGGIAFVQCKSGKSSSAGSPLGSREVTPDTDRDAAAAEGTTDFEVIGDLESDEYKPQRTSRTSRSSLDSLFGRDVQVFKAKGSPVSSGTATPTSTSSGERRILKDPSELVRDGLNSLSLRSDLQSEEVEKMSSVQPTMWMGAQSGSLYVHSSVAQWKRCLHSVKLRDSILNIVHVKGRVLAALADGTVAIFHRATDGQWDLQNYHLLDLGKPHHSIRCMSVIANSNVWCGYRNKIHVVDPQSMTITKSFDAHPRKESQVRQLAWLGDGVWVSIRLDSTLRLYHAYTYQHLQDVDIEPYVSKMLGTGKLGFSFVRITSMLISCNRLWIGTGNGVIISVPLSESNKQTVSMGGPGGRPGGIVRVYSDNKTDSVTPASFIPYCTMAQAQLSFHGHRDAVKFFVAVPGNKRKGLSAAVDEITTESSSESSGQKEATPAQPSNTKLVISGGEGYVDFRIGDGDDELPGAEEEEEKKVSLSKGDRSHLIVWEVTTPQD